jgi:hypothetical protein
MRIESKAHKRKTRNREIKSPNWKNRNLHARTQTNACLSRCIGGLTSFFFSLFCGVLAPLSAADMAKVQRRPGAALSIVVVVARAQIIDHTHTQSSASSVLSLEKEGFVLNNALGQQRVDGFTECKR